MPVAVVAEPTAATVVTRSAEGEAAVSVVVAAAAAGASLPTSAVPPLFVVAVGPALGAAVVV